MGFLRALFAFTLESDKAMGEFTTDTGMIIHRREAAH